MKSKTTCPKCERAELTFETYGKDDMLAACPSCGLSVIVPTARLFMGKKERMEYVKKHVIRLNPETRKVKPYTRLKPEAKTVKS